MTTSGGEAPCTVYRPHAAHGQCPGVGASTPTHRVQMKSGRVLHMEGMSLTPPTVEGSPVEWPMMVEEFMDSFRLEDCRGRYIPLDLSEEPGDA